ncbi:hypothetical protein O9992_09295 [Vibrio lentus]|nr:hypothetical protein [Vibrio lentus]
MQTNQAKRVDAGLGAVQIYYGDEIARDFGPTGSDPMQGTRSDMPWDQITGERAQLLETRQTLGQFRQRALSGCSQGKHIIRNSKGYYAFERQYQDDKVLGRLYRLKVSAD